MALPKTITSANSKVTLLVAGLALGPYTLEGYAADTAFAVQPTDVAETQMGVDGKMSAGYVPFITPIEFTLQADSPSVEFFDAWLGGEKAVKEISYANGSIDIPSIGKRYVLTKGALKRVSQVPAAGKVLLPVVYAIDFQDVQPTPLVG